MIVTHDVYHMGFHPEDDDLELDVPAEVRRFDLTLVEDVSSDFGACTVVRGEYRDVCRFVTWLYGAVEDPDDVIAMLPHALDPEDALVY